MFVASDQTRFLLPENEIPKQWYNIVPDLPTPPTPVLHPGTGQPVGPADLLPLFPMEIIKQEVSTDRWIDIPDPVRDAYRLFRPSPLIRARRLEKLLDTPAHIYYKYEGGSPSGSHKINTALPHASITRKRAQSASRPRPVLDSGERPCPSLARWLASNARSTW